MQEITQRDLEIAWAAGLFEGEGNFAADRDGYPRAQLSSTDHDVLMRFATVVGVGYTMGPYMNRPPARKPHWRWLATDPRSFLRFAELVEPYLGERRLARLNEIRTTSRLADPRYVAGDRTRIEIPIDEAIRYYATGESLEQVGARFGVSGACIGTRLRRHGVELRSPGWPQGRATRPLCPE